MSGTATLPMAAPAGAASARRRVPIAVAPAAVAALVATVAVGRTALAFDVGSGGDGVWLVVDIAAAWVLAGWAVLRLLDDRRDGAGHLLQWSSVAWAVAALCETGGMRPEAWLPFGSATADVQVYAHLLARSLLVAAVVVVLPDREADGFLRRGLAEAAIAGLVVVVLVALAAEPATEVLRETPFGFGHRTWIEAGRRVAAPLLAAMVAVEGAALVALHRARRGLPPTSFQVIAWGLVAAAVPLAVPGLEERLPVVAVDLLAVVVFPALPVVSVVAVLRTVLTVGRTIARLRLAQQRMVDAVEDERRRLRHELHDGLGPALAGIALGIRAAAGTDDKASATQLLGRLADETEACLEEVRRIVYDLRPPALDQLGLRGAIVSYAERCCNAPGGPSLEVAVAELADLPASLELTAYRIAVEAVTNAVRHARAQTLRVALRERDGLVTVEVEDDGNGLPADLPAGVGLTSMRERAESVGGSLSIGTGPGGGTLVRADLPRPHP